MNTRKEQAMDAPDGTVMGEGFWCEHEGIYYTDADEHPDRFVGLREEEITALQDDGHFGYACPGAGLPRLSVKIVVEGGGV